MPTADEKTLQEAPVARDATDPSFPPPPVAAGTPKGATIRMPILSLEAGPVEGRDAGEATIVGQDLDRTDPGGPGPFAAADTEPPAGPRVNAPVKPVDHDQLLRALSSYRRPDKPVEAAASDGAPAAQYSGGIHDLAPATRTPAPLPPILVERTLPPLAPRQGALVRPDASPSGPTPPQDAQLAPTPFARPSPTPVSERRPSSWNVTAAPTRPRPAWVLLVVLGVTAVVVVVAIGVGARMLQSRAASQPPSSATLAAPSAGLPAASTPLPASPAVPPLAVPTPTPSSPAVQEVSPAFARPPVAVVSSRSPSMPSPSPSTRPSAAPPAVTPPRTDVLRTL